MVRVVSAPITLIDERLWPECRHCVFYLFKAFFYIYWLSLQWILAIGCFVLFLPPFSFGWHAFGWGLLCKRLFYYQAGFLWLEFMCCFCWVLPLYAFILCLFSFFRLLKWLLFWAWASVNHSFFTPWLFLFPLLFPLCYSPVSAMHLGNQEMESDAEDEVNHTLPTMCCPLR